MIGVYIPLKNVTVEQYKTMDEQVTASGASTEGLIMHSCFAEGEQLAVFDVWESEEAFQAFASTLKAIAGPAADAIQPQLVEMVDFRTP